MTVNVEDVIYNVKQIGDHFFFKCISFHVIKFFLYICCKLNSIHNMDKRKKYD